MTDGHFRNDVHVSGTRGGSLVSGGTTLSEVLERLDIHIDLTLTGPLARRFDRECKARDREPADLMGEIIEVIIQDSLFAAVLDEEN